MINIFNKIVTVKGKISEVNIEGSTTGQGASNYTSTFLIENQKVSFHTCFYPYFHFSNNEELIISGVLVDNILVGYTGKHLQTNTYFHGYSLIIESIWFIFSTFFTFMGLLVFYTIIVNDKIIESLNINSLIGLLMWIIMLFLVASSFSIILNILLSRISCWRFLYRSRAIGTIPAIVPKAVILTLGRINDSKP